MSDDVSTNYGTVWRSVFAWKGQFHLQLVEKVLYSFVKVSTLETEDGSFSPLWTPNWFKIAAAANWAEVYHGPFAVHERMTHEILAPVMTQTR